MTGQLLDTAFYGSGGILGKYGMGESKFCVLLHHPDERGNRMLIYLEMHFTRRAPTRLVHFNFAIECS